MIKFAPQLLIISGKRIEKIFTEKLLLSTVQFRFFVCATLQRHNFIFDLCFSSFIWWEPFSHYACIQIDCFYCFQDYLCNYSFVNFNLLNCSINKYLMSIQFNSSSAIHTLNNFWHWTTVFTPMFHFSSWLWRISFRPYRGWTWTFYRWLCLVHKTGPCSAFFWWFPIYI